MAHEGEGQSPGGIDTEQWLSANKLSDVVDMFVERDISIEELADFEQGDLASFADDLKLDTLAKRRFLKAMRKLRQPQAQVPVASAKRKVIISSEEEQALNDLYRRFDECSELQTTIQTALVPSNVQGLEHAFDIMLEKLRERRDE